MVQDVSEATSLDTQSQVPPTGHQETTSDDSGWTQHTTKEGKIFWFHAATGKSTWKKPDALKSDLEKLMGMQTSWKEYATPEGRPYWYNKETKASVWTCPPEVQALKDELSCSWEVFADKATASERLKTLFKLKGVGVRARFEEALTLVKADKRFSLFNCLTTGEKKQVFSEYQTQIQKQQRERERLRKAEARRIFLDVLAQWPGLHPAALLRDFQAAYNTEWWWSCLSAAEHDDLFNDCVEEHQVQFSQTQREQRHVLRQKITEFLTDSKNNFSVDQKWGDVVERLLEQPAFSNAEPRILLGCWEDYVQSRDREEEDLQHKRVYREQRKRRDAFKALVETEISAGRVNARTSFLDFAEQHSHEPAYTSVVGVPAAVPRELYAACVQPLVESYEKGKAALKRIFRNKEQWTLTITPETTFEDFELHLQSILPTVEEDQDTAHFTSVNLKLLLESLKRRATRRDGEKRGSAHDSTASVTNVMGDGAGNEEASQCTDEQRYYHKSRLPLTTTASSSTLVPGGDPLCDTRDDEEDDDEEEEGIVPSSPSTRARRRCLARQQQLSRHDEPPHSSRRDNASSPSPRSDISATTVTKRARHERSALSHRRARY